MQQELERLTLENELLSSIMEAASHSFVSNPISLESREGERKVEAPIIGLETKPVGGNAHVTVAVGCSSLNPEAAE